MQHPPTNLAGAGVGVGAGVNQLGNGIRPEDHRGGTSTRGPVSTLGAVVNLSGKQAKKAIRQFSNASESGLENPIGPLPNAHPLPPRPQSKRSNLMRRVRVGAANDDTIPSGRRSSMANHFHVPSVFGGGGGGGNMGTPTSPGPRDDEMERQLRDKYTKQEITEYRQLFCVFDTDGSGAIGSDELKEAIMSIGMQFDDSEIDNLIKEVDKDGNGEIDFSEFCDCMKKSQSLAKSSNEEIIRQCFDIFDQDGNGIITENEFKYVAKEIGEFTDELAEHVFHELDISSNGHISLDQFAAIVDDYLLRDKH